MSGPQPKAEAQLAARAKGIRGEEPGMTLEKQKATVCHAGTTKNFGLYAS